MVYLRASETFTWSRATCPSSVIRRTLSQTVRTFVFREVPSYCGVRTRVELVEVVHPALEVATPNLVSETFGAL